ncbi:hypothetical protein L6452_28032 [Arctium lappa]|uniref:Uncharacterized protein n=1 Tax=Arctium lappa TaxID=4217 RepID=A0ACB8ZWE8_ARCLA|nr:hypothetical protein L6452_28032 [Arctium lappa]
MAKPLEKCVRIKRLISKIPGISYRIRRNLALIEIIGLSLSRLVYHLLRSILHSQRNLALIAHLIKRS